MVAFRTLMACAWGLREVQLSAKVLLKLTFLGGNTLSFHFSSLLFAEAPGVPRSSANSSLGQDLPLS